MQSDRNSLWCLQLRRRALNRRRGFSQSPRRARKGAKKLCRSAAPHLTTCRSICEGHASRPSTRRPEPMTGRERSRPQTSACFRLRDLRAKQQPRTRQFGIRARRALPPLKDSTGAALSAAVHWILPATRPPMWNGKPTARILLLSKHVDSPALARDSPRHRPIGTPRSRRCGV
jgi:hypothetical protein